jgi:hypothetical protein
MGSLVERIFTIYNLSIEDTAYDCGVYMGIFACFYDDLGSLVFDPRQHRGAYNSQREDVHVLGHLHCGHLAILTPRRVMGARWGYYDQCPR